MESWKKVPSSYLPSRLRVPPPPASGVSTIVEKGVYNRTRGGGGGKVSEGLMVPSRHLCSPPSPKWASKRNSASPELTSSLSQMEAGLSREKA